MFEESFAETRTRAQEREMVTPASSRTTSRRRYVLDANALIGFFEDRRVVAEKVRHLLSEPCVRTRPCLMSAVNWGEVFLHRMEASRRSNGPRS